MTNKPEFTNEEIADLFDHFRISKSSDAPYPSGILLWKKSPAKRIKEGSAAGSYVEKYDSHFTHFRGRKIPTLYILYILFYSKKPTVELKIKGCIVPSINGFIRVDSKDKFLLELDGVEYNFVNFHNKEFFSKILFGIQFDAKSSKYRLYLYGKYHSRYDTQVEAVLAKAFLLNLADSTIQELKTLFKSKKLLPWGLPEFQKVNVVFFAMREGSTIYKSNSWKDVSKCWVKHYKKRKKLYA